MQADSITDSTDATIGEAPFDAASKMTSIQGRAYLEVKWRLVWLRDQHPDATIETDLIRDDGTVAVFKARVVVPTGGSATGWGQESYQDFGDYLEKAETKALGRALAALGYGTQFCDDHTFDSADRGRVVDSPVDFANRPRGGARGIPDLLTEKQLKAMYAIGGNSGVDVRATCLAKYGVVPEQLARRNASEFIDFLKQPAAAPAPPAPQRPLQQAPPPEPLMTPQELLKARTWLENRKVMPDQYRGMAIDLYGRTIDKLTKAEGSRLMEALATGRMREADGRWVIDEPPAEGDRRGGE